MTHLSTHNTYIKIASNHHQYLQNNHANFIDMCTQLIFTCSEDHTHVLTFMNPHFIGLHQIFHKLFPHKLAQSFIIIIPIIN